jgi:hypothetical protein
VARDHESRIKTDAELAGQLGLLLAVSSLGSFHEGARASIISRRKTSQSEQTEWTMNWSRGKTSASELRLSSVLAHSHRRQICGKLTGDRADGVVQPDW